MSKLDIETFRASTMIVNSLGHYLAETVQDHEKPDPRALPSVPGIVKEVKELAQRHIDPKPRERTRGRNAVNGDK
jgi:hypothetical protein